MCRQLRLAQSSFQTGSKIYVQAGRIAESVQTQMQSFPAVKVSGSTFKSKLYEILCTRLACGASHGSLSRFKLKQS